MNLTLPVAARSLFLFALAAGPLHAVPGGVQSANEPNALVWIAATPFLVLGAGLILVLWRTLRSDGAGHLDKSRQKAEQAS